MLATELLDLFCVAYLNIGIQLLCCGIRMPPQGEPHAFVVQAANTMQSYGQKCVGVFTDFTRWQMYNVCIYVFICSFNFFVPSI